MAKLILARHGESEWNKLGRWTGLTDVPLSEAGREEAVKAGHFLMEIPIDIAYASLLKRTVQTANRILDFQAVKPELIRTAALNERDYGTYTGQRKQDVQRALGNKTFQLIRRSWDHPIIGGETLKHIHDRRIVPFHNNVAFPLLMEGQNVLVVSSNNPLRAYVKLLEDVPPARVGEIELGTAEVRIYDFDQAGKIIDHTSHVIGDVH